jgi:exonuclease SbcC
MLVELEFLARGERYRVNRRHTRPRTGRQGATILELQASTANGYHAISGNTVHETEVKIQQLLSMDYQTFINTAFLMQGRADEFTHATPATRKTVLSQILNLGLFDRLEERAKEASSHHRQQSSILLGQIEQLEVTGKQIPELRSELNETNQELTGINDTTKQHNEKLTEIRDLHSNLAKSQEELEQINNRIIEATNEESQLNAQLQAHQQRISDFSKILEDAQSVEANHSNLLKTRSELEDYEHKQYETMMFENQKTDLDKVIALAKQQIEQEHKQLQETLNDQINPLVQTIPKIEKQIENTSESLRQLNIEEQKLIRERQQVQDLNTEEQKLAHLQAQVEQDGTNIKTRLGLLQTNHDTILCPICNTALGEEGRRSLYATYESQIQERRQDYKNISEELHIRRVNINDLGSKLKTKEHSITEQKLNASRDLAALEHQLKSARNFEKQQQKYQMQISILTEKLDSNRYAETEQAKLQELENQIQLLNYNKEKHGIIQQQSKLFESMEDAYRRLLEAQQRLPDEKQALGRIQSILLSRQKISQLEIERQKSLQSQIAQLPQVRHQIKEMETIQHELTQQQLQLTARLAALETTIRYNESRERETSQKQAQLKSHQQEQGVFSELATAFGKGGVQALLIEAIVPELEAEANRLLHQLTQGRMNLKMETQRERRTRGDAPPIETLDIIASDELGSRNYEMFSGGEAFRINFALRIALSKLLARRAGAPLPTLFIDEGFGTQDSQGREDLLNAIKSIEPDFDRIIVITHLEEVKERFPVRIEVSKTETGSTFWINYN